MAALILVFSAGPRSLVFAGTTGSVAGVVHDADGGAIGLARVSIASPSQSEKTTSDAWGAFSLSSLARRATDRVWFVAGHNQFCYPVTNAPLLGQAVAPPLGFIETTIPFMPFNAYLQLTVRM